MRVSAAIERTLVARNQTSSTKYHLAVVIPCHHESEELVSALEHYASLSPFCVELRFFVLLSHPSAGEGPRQVKAMLDRWVAKFDLHRMVHSLTCPPSCQTKALKLEHLWTTLGEELKASDQWYLVIDVDARMTDIPKIGGIVNYPDCAAIYQALPVTDAHGESPSLLVRALAVAQAERSAMECWALDRWAGQERPFLLGLMGAAMLFNTRAVDTLRPWPPDSDDISVGYRADLLDIPRYLLPAIVMVQAAPSFLDWLNQNVKVSLGVQTRWLEISRSRVGLLAGLSLLLRSLAFDWTPGLRLVALLALGWNLFSLGVVWGVFGLAILITLQIGVSMKMYKQLTHKSGAVRIGLVSLILLSTLGSVAWPILRTLAAIIAALTLPSVRAKFHRRVTPKTGGT